MPILRLPKGSLRDEIRQPLYDTVEIAAAESPVGIRQFFSSVQGKSKALSNLTQNSQLRQATSFRIQGFAMDCQNIYLANKSALALIQENSSLRVRIGEKDYWETALIYLTGRIAQNAAVTDPAVATSVIQQNYGEVALQPVMLSGKHVVDITPLQTFYAEWTVSGMNAAEITASTPAANTRLKFMFSFKGLLRRAVQ